MIATDFRYGLDGEFPVVRCRGCGLVYLNPRPSPSALGRYYPAHYQPHRVDVRQHHNPVAAALRSLAFRRLPGSLGAASAWLYNSLAFRAFLRDVTPGRVLDVGCGPGDYLAVWQQLGWHVEGVEPNPEVARRAAERLGARVHAGFIEEVSLPDGGYDVITMSHSLEHVPSPRTVLGILRAALARNGRLVLMVPNFAAWDRRVFGATWYGLEVPRHLYHFEPATITALLEAVGFEVEQLGGSSQPDVVIRNLRRTFGRDPERPSTMWQRAAIGGALLPMAVLRCSTSLWVVARARR